MFASCSYISEYSQLMYAIVCKQVLSDVGEHKAEGFFNFDGHRIHKKQDSLGMIYSISFHFMKHFIICYKMEFYV